MDNLGLATRVTQMPIIMAIPMDLRLANIQVGCSRLSMGTRPELILHLVRCIECPDIQELDHQ